MLAFLILLYYK